MVNHNSQTALAGEPNTIGPRGMISQKKASRGTQGLPAVTFLVFSRQQCKPSSLQFSARPKDPKIGSTDSSQANLAALRA